MLNITLLRCGSAGRPPELSARAFALVASDRSIRRHRAGAAMSTYTLLRSHNTSNTFLELVVGKTSWRTGASSPTTPG